MQAILEACYEYTQIQGIYINRGDPGAWDFQVGDFTTDGAWHDLDLSAIVPVNAKAVDLTIGIADDLVSQLLRLRRNGNANEIANKRAMTQVANITYWTNRVVGIDTNRIIEYALTNTVWTLVNVAVAGWWY